MPDSLGPDEYNSTQLAINLMILQMNDIECQITKNSEDNRLLHKHQSTDVEGVQYRYGSEIKQVRNDMRECEDKTSNEYFELMSELEELEENRDAEIKRIENETTDKEQFYEAQKTTLETQYEAVKADKEGIEQMQESNLKN